MSTSVVINDWLPPDERYRTLDVDYEAGPIALNDPTAGLAYQPWELTWDLGTGNFTVTPETTGSPSVVLNSGGANVTQLSLAFDQNGHVNVAYTANTGTFLYWYDSLISNWVTTQLPAAVFMPTLTLDDKRITQTNASDIMLWWTEEQPDGTYNLYRAYQRDRFNPLVPKEMATDINPYIYKLGMHKGFRLQLGLSDRVL